MDALESVLQFLSPIRHLVQNPEISEVEINSPSSVWYERDGVRYREAVELDTNALEGAVKRIAHAAGEEVLDRRGELVSPALNCRFADGSRLAVLFPPHSINGVSLVLRRFNVSHLTLDDLVSRGMLESHAAECLVEAVRSRKNVLIAGAMGSGKTTLANVLLDYIPTHERVLVIENPAEFRSKRVDPAFSNAVRWEARGKFTQARLLEQALRFGADRLVLGEFRGEEALTLLMAMNTGHSGCISTCHATSGRDALSRFLVCALMARRAPAEASIKRMIGSTVELVAHLQRDESGKRFVREIVQVSGYDDSTGQYELETLYQYGAHATC